MIDTRTVGQELQDQVRGAARKGRERVTSTVKTVTDTAQHIRPQLQNLPRPNLTRPALVTPAQLREKAPALVAMLPSPQQLRSGAEELAGHARAAALRTLGQVRSITEPIVHEAAARLARFGSQASQETTTRVRDVRVTGNASANEDGTKAKAQRATGGTSKPKPKPKAAAK